MYRGAYREVYRGVYRVVYRGVYRGVYRELYREVRFSFPPYYYGDLLCTRSKKEGITDTSSI